MYVIKYFYEIWSTASFIIMLLMLFSGILRSTYVYKYFEVVCLHRIADLIIPFKLNILRILYACFRFYEIQIQPIKPKVNP